MAPFGKRVNHLSCLPSYLVNIWVFLQLNIYSCDRMEFSPRMSRLTLRESGVRNGSLLFMVLPFTGWNSKVIEWGLQLSASFIPVSNQACGFEEAVTILEVHVINHKKQAWAGHQAALCLNILHHSVLTLSLLS